MALVSFPGTSPPYSAEPEEDDEDASGKMSFLEHLEELRVRLIVSLGALLGGFCLALFFIENIVDFVYKPLAGALAGGKFIYTEPMEGFMLRMKIAALAGLFVALPIILWQVWRFVAPGLYENEKRYAVPFVASALALFACGAGLAYWTLPQALEFLIAVGGEDLVQFFSPGRYLSLVTFMMIAFGIGFQFPLVVTAAQLVGLVTNQKLRSIRRYVLVGIVLVVAIVTPSADPYSLLMLAVPMYVSYELALIVGRFAGR
jgi:sec-independent protein translocase protein TatC